VCIGERNAHLHRRCREIADPRLLHASATLSPHHFLIATFFTGAAGGLTSLSKIPACNIQLLGQQKKAGTGFSSAAGLPNTGFIYYSEIVQSQPPEYRKKAARLVAAKAVRKKS
jgi:hypothetical protein